MSAIYIENIQNVEFSNQFESLVVKRYLEINKSRRGRKRKHWKLDGKVWNYSMNGKWKVNILGK